MNWKNKKVLILGGSGTLGTELIEQLLQQEVHSIRSYSRNEEKVFWLRKKYGDDRMRYFIGDIRDKERLNLAFTDVDIVINCAALKHVKLCSDNPFESIKTNVQGTQNAIECAIQNNVEVFVQISTDKAVNPICTYGYTKALSEQLTLEAPNYQGNNRTKFIVVRSGNIMNSSGSCFEIWDRQYNLGEPLTVTDLNAERYMAFKCQIGQAILDIIPQSENGLYVLYMPLYKVSDLISKYKDAEIKIIGLQSGEKLKEELTRENEKHIKITV